MIVIDLIKKLETFNPLMEVVIDVTPSQADYFMFTPVDSVENCQINEEDGEVVVISRMSKNDWENEEKPFTGLN